MSVVTSATRTDGGLEKVAKLQADNYQLQVNVCLLQRQCSKETNERLR